MSPLDATGFWREARHLHPDLPVTPPEAWAFGATPEQADELVELVIDGVKTATASSFRDYALDNEPLPAVGDMSIVLDGSGVPRAILEVTDVDIVPFAQVGEEHARAEGEGDRTLATWRRLHEGFWREHSPQGFSPDMPVLCERFRVIHAVHAKDGAPN